MIDVEVRLAARSEKDAVAQLLELYLHDLSELTAADVGAGGRYGYRYLDDYWTEVECHPFLFRVDDRLAGLALVQAGAPHDMSEFFVMRRYRRRGVGRRAALALFTRFPGEWQVRQLAANRVATTFWRSVIPVPFSDDTIEMGPVQRFRIDPTESIAKDGPMALASTGSRFEHGHHADRPVMTTELEAKLTPPEGFRIPMLEELSSGWGTLANPAREFDAVYYDTADLDLARWGITLRHRLGESGRPWTLKLPDHVSEAALAREELRFDGTVDAVPIEASDLVRGFTRERPLERVARLRTTRTPVQVRDADGHILIEVVDDSVEICEGEGALDHFREVEVEATSNDRRSRAALRTAVAALVDAGCRIDKPPIPKLVRALGPRALQPPSVVVLPVEQDASTTDLIRHLSASSVVQILMCDPGVRLGHDPESVHMYRVATRRLRADLRTFSPMLDEARTNGLRNELRWLSQAAGPVRDLDVLGARFATHAHDLADVDQSAAAGLLVRLAASRHDAHQRLLEVLRSERYDRTLRGLVDFATSPPTTPHDQKAAKPAASLARRLVRRRWKHLAEVVKTAGDAATDSQLHKIRIAAKRCRYAAEALVPVVGHPARHFAAAVEEVQTVLGDYHDTVVAEAWLRDAAIELVDCRLAIGALIASERQARRHLRMVWPAVWHQAAKPTKRAWLSNAHD